MTGPPSIPIAARVLAFVSCGIELPPDEEGLCIHSGCQEKAHYWPALQQWRCLAHFIEYSQSMKALQAKVEGTAILEVPVCCQK